jgi:hypothetical protein
MSFDHKDKDQKFLVAYMNDATFIAFQGMKTLEDVINTFQIDHYSKGHFHKGFLKHLDVFNVGMAPYLPLLESLSKPERHIILCEHVVGGVVWHMILLCILYYGKLDCVSLH